MSFKRHTKEEVRVVCGCCGAWEACQGQKLEQHRVNWAGPDADFEFWDGERLQSKPSPYTRVDGPELPNIPGEGRGGK